MIIKSFPTFTLPDNLWVNLNTVLSVSVGTPLIISNSGVSGGYIYVNDVPPLEATDGFLLSRVREESAEVFISEGSETVWVKGVGSKINVHLLNPTAPPLGVYTGTRAMTTQSYEEANIKLGIQFEGSKNFGEVSGGAVLNTIFRTGSLPVSLKRRIVSFTGVGLTASVYENPTFTGGTNASYQNATTVNPQTGLAQIIVNSTLTDDGTLAFAPIHAFGNASNQGKGGVLTLVEPEHILAPNTDFLLRLTSLDDGTQTVASHLAWYEGLLDLPRP